MSTMSNKPNILFLHSHNTGRYVEPFGHAISTPHLQQLAAEGVVFRRAFAVSPTCSPSRASFMTGAYPHSCGMLGLAHRGFAMSDYGWHLARGLRTAGYETALAGVEHTAPDVRDVGYSQILSAQDNNFPEDGPQMGAAEAAVQYLSGGPAEPFFLSVGLEETHRPFPRADTRRYPNQDARYTLPPRPFPDTPETRADMADFKAAARVMDEKYGRVLQGLRDSGLSDRTLVFCFSDHGLQFPRNMCNLTDHGLGVYLVIRGPGFGGGRVVDAMVSLIDLVPTIYEAMGLPSPEHTQGKAIQPLVAGDAECLHDHLFAEVNYHAAYEPMRSVRTDRYKYIRRYDGRTHPVLPNIDDNPSKDYLLSMGWADQRPDAEALYDVILDPDETNNLIDRPGVRDVARELSARLEGWMEKTKDPLLPTGHVEAPARVRVNDADGLSPRDKPRIM